MDYLTAVDHAAHQVGGCTDPPDHAVQAALGLVVHAWQHSDSADPDLMVAWDLFGTDVHTALVDLYPTAEPIAIILDEDRLPDTAVVRAAAAGLAAVVAARLETAAGNPAADPGRRWVWSATAARLARAADGMAAAS